MYRQKHINTPDLAYDAELTRKAQAYAEELAKLMVDKNALILNHDKNRGSVGENLYASWGTDKGGLEVFCPKVLNFFLTIISENGYFILIWEGIKNGEYFVTPPPQKKKKKKKKNPSIKYGFSWFLTAGK